MLPLLNRIYPESQYCDKCHSWKDEYEFQSSKSLYCNYCIVERDAPAGRVVLPVGTKYRVAVEDELATTPIYIHPVDLGIMSIEPVPIALLAREVLEDRDPVVFAVDFSNRRRRA